MPEERTAVAALYVEQDTIYYTCKQFNDKKEASFMLRKCTLNHGKCDFYIPGFNHVRGIARDSKGNYYVVETREHRVLKFDDNFKPLKRSNKKAHRFLFDPHGIFIDKEENIFICSKIKRRICVLNIELTILYLLELEFSPVSITKFAKEIFVTTNNAIVVLNIDLINLKFEFKTHRGIVMADGNTETLDDNNDNDTERRICAGEEFLYVAEYGKSGRLLCLKYDNNNLYCVGSEENCTKLCSKSCSSMCSPVALAYHNGKVYYSQGDYEEKFHIVVLMTHGKTVTSTKLFDA